MDKSQFTKRNNLLVVFASSTFDSLSILKEQKENLKLIHTYIKP
jgi:hypothetical protein